jgi:ribosomal protein L11 methyltransferase
MTDVVRVAVSVQETEREATIARLLVVAPQGFDEESSGHSTEFGVYVSRDDSELVRSSFPGSRIEEVPPGWEDGWREFHHGVSVGGLWIGPPWEARPEDAPAVVIDPGRAFGTGAHPTTRLCVELLARLASRGHLLDVGCGSGVLAIAAVRLGFRPVVAVDVDPVAVEVAGSNAAANGVVIETDLVDAAVDRLPPADVVVANIALGTVGLVLERADAADAITAGYLPSEQPAVPGWRSMTRLELDGWAADHFRRETV